MEKIVLIDGHNLLFRIFFGIPSSIRNSKGKEIKGLIGFIGSIKRIAKELNPCFLIVVFDSESSRSNNELIDTNYKKGRVDYYDVEENNNPFSQLPLIKKALDYLEIFNIEVEENEADDYIASIINKYRSKEYEFYIISSDTDFIQLITDNVFMFSQKGKESFIYNKDVIKSKYDILPEQYVEFKSLVGDKCDNIRGIAGIGPKTASKILKYGSINKFIDNDTDNKLKQVLRNNEHTIKKNIKLITLNNNLEIKRGEVKIISNKLASQKVNEIISAIGER
jgi:DNA polymerase-1